MDLFHQQKQEITQVQRMQAGMQVSMMLEKPREVFWKMISDLENSSIFRKLHGIKGNRRAIKIKPIKKTILLPDSRFAAAGSVDVESLIQGRDDLISRIREMGIEKFRFYFLEGEGTDAEISELLDIDPDMVREFRNGIIERIQIFDSVYTPSPSYSSVGSISPLEVAADIYPLKNSLQVDFARYRTRYEIDEQQIDKLLNGGSLTGEEVKEVRPLIAGMKRINERFNLLNRIIETVVEEQKAFLITGNEEKLKVLEGKKVAEMLDVDPSWISRVIKGKYLRLRKRIIPLRDLFISEKELKKKVGKSRVRRILQEEKEKMLKGTLPTPYSDQHISLILENRYRKSYSRRTINNWRREIAKEDRR